VVTNVTLGARRGRGARERILAAARDLFLGQGIAQTHMSELSAAANVSTRTLYAHFPGKDDVVQACLQDYPGILPPDADLAEMTAGSARELLLNVFADKVAMEPKVRRGCLFLNTGVEYADPHHPVHRYIALRKQLFAEELANLAGRAGARRPEELGQQLALIYDGMAARAMALNDPTVSSTALALATRLLEDALQTR
jgi:AcrR family transcriptional regulator